MEQNAAFPLDGETLETQKPSFATIAAVYTDGVSLLLDGESEPTQKHYQTNTSIAFKAGDRVKILRDSNTYVVEYKVGAPPVITVADYCAWGHRGDYIGFFNPKSVYPQQSISNLPSNATLATTVSRLNALLNILRTYNLVK